MDETSKTSNNTFWKKVKTFAWLVSTGKAFYASPISIAIELGLGKDVPSSQRITPFESRKNSLFREIAEGRRQVETLHATSSCVVIHDKRPRAEVHLLVLPRKSLNSVLSLKATKDDILLGKLLVFGLAKEI